MFVSFDDGEGWQSLQLNLPNCSVRDIALRRGDVVIGTHGRSFWVLDDASPLRQLDAKAAGAGAWLYAPRSAVRLNPASFQGTPEPRDEPAAENPPRGAVLDYVLKSAGPVVLEILDARGGTVSRFSSEDAAEPPDLQKIQVTEDWMPSPQPPSGAAGMHRLVWDLHFPTPRELSRGRRGARAGVWAPPGQYVVRLTAGGMTLTQPLEVVKDPRVAASEEDLVRQFDLARRVEAERVRIAGPLSEAIALRGRIAAVAPKASGKAADALAALERALLPVAGPAVSPEEFYNLSDAAPASLLRLSASLSRFQAAVESADAAPTPDAVAGFDARHALVEQSLAGWHGFLDAELPKANRALAAASLPPLSVER
jgi:hypothetical protein